MVIGSEASREANSFVIIRTEMTAAAKDRYDDLIATGGIPMARWGLKRSAGP
ncbi:MULTISPECIES: hypothetical protein [Bradyrhizobium]|uniref:Uncharacterized protein n=2 Tax=Bradyrhizobium TaxID=374 RepID=A0A9X1RB05_9BRAD|nr:MULTISPECIES: hypothetical protein [Bradyrhizobium]MCG2629479.1 hypothetical protein [Bradyrhizobium zhengyangense]MCG2644893.1 hypothetical protein [Bradyrhizobium zhengyangense]MCG2670993.1 hypothetical protein [Bradyrhizobium zhengyangense]MDN4984628.1 hypothetical protein [Bradyrhizobium sp. WYCCWR 13022]MDN5002620.1 hypothetical protein [Bradyrhizobium sp. WYCCWR 12677]